MVVLEGIRSRRETNWAEKRLVPTAWCRAPFGHPRQNGAALLGFVQSTLRIKSRSLALDVNALEPYQVALCAAGRRVPAVTRANVRVFGYSCCGATVAARPCGDER